MLQALPHEHINDITLTCCYSFQWDWGKFEFPYQKEFFFFKKKHGTQSRKEEVKSAVTALESTARESLLVDGLLIYIVIN